MSRYQTDEYRAKHAAQAREWRKTNKSSNNERCLRWAKANPEKVRAAQRRHSLKKLYGLTPEQWASMFESQGSCCAICGTNESKRGTKTSWAVDHCHRTGAVRGILCHQCNAMLGYARDSRGTLAAAIVYLDAQTDADTPPVAKDQLGLFEGVAA